MKKKDCFYLGKVTKTHGYKGEVTVFLDVDQPATYKGLDCVFIEMIKDKDLIPFYIVSSAMGNNAKMFVRFEDYTTVEQASKLVNKPLYLPAELLEKRKGKDFYYHDIIGYTVVDEAWGTVGIITDIIEANGQTILSVKHEEKEALIPAANEILKKVVKTRKVVEVKCPEGLLELYLG